jgi:ABC-type branched-subunit amino acid transport system substrate-binding protein
VKTGSWQRLVILLLPAGLGCADKAPESTTVSAALGSNAVETIHLGALVDATGSTTTPLYGNAITLAVNQMNQALAGNPRNHVQFDVSFGDDHNNTPALARSETLRLLNTAGVVAMVSDSSGDTVAVNKLNYEAASPAPYKVPITCFQCSSGFINNPNVVEVDPLTQAAERDVDNWLFRIFYNANFEAAVLDRVVLEGGTDRNGDGIFKMAIYADGGHLSLANALGPTMAQLYGSAFTTELIVYSGNPANRAAEWARVVDGFNETTQTNDGIPDVVILAQLPPNVVSAVSSYRAAGYTLPVVSNNSFRRNFILPQMGSMAEGLEGSSVALANDGPSGQAFVSAFTAAFGQGPEITSSGAYDSAMTLMLAAVVARRTLEDNDVPVGPADIRAALPTINDPNGTVIRPTVAGLAMAADLVQRRQPINYQGAYDNVDWNAVGDIFPRMVHWKVQNGQFVETESFTCDPAHPLCPAN